MKKVALGAVLLVILAGITIWVTQKDSSSTMRTELTNFAMEDTARISRIVLKGEEGNRVDLSKVDNTWMVDDQFEARPDAIRNLLTTMKKLSVKAPISEGMKSTVLKNIIADHTLVEVYDGGELLKTYYVGGPDKEHTGTFMLMQGSSRPYLMHIEGFHGFLTPRFFTNPLEWRHRAVFEYKPSQIANLKVSYPQNASKDFSIKQDQPGEFQVFTGSNAVPASNLDTFMLNAYLNNYKMVHYEGYEETKSQDFIDSVLQSQPIFRIELTDKSGNQKTVQGYRKPLSAGYEHEGTRITHDVDRLYLRIDSEKVVVGQYAIFDKLTEGIGFLRSR